MHISFNIADAILKEINYEHKFPTKIEWLNKKAVIIQIAGYYIFTVYNHDERYSIIKGER